MQIKRSLYLYTVALRRAVAGVLCALPLLAAADADCPRAEAKSADGMQIEFKQYQFPDGTADLILRHAGENGTMEIRRVTYGGSKTEACQYQSLAIVPGGGEKQWGWHLAWAGAKGLRYARMDGNAWVSSPPKRLSGASVSEVRLQINGNELLIWWHEQNGDQQEVYQAVSHDEGRSWESPQQFHAAD